MPWCEGHAPEETVRRAVTHRGSLYLTQGISPSLPATSLMVRQFSRCLVGGTFDRFHAGHIYLLDLALSKSQHVEVWITDDKMVSDKVGIPLELDRRMDELSEWAELKHGDRISLHILRDKFGPALHRKDCDAITCTIETKRNCLLINEQRYAAGLEALEIIVAPHIEDGAGGIISSTRIRAGIIDRDGNPWLVDDDQDRKMPKVLDDSLKQPMGILYEGPEEYPELAMLKALEEIPEPSSIIAVGDVCVQTMLEIGVRPWIGFIDGRTKRQLLDESETVSTEGWEAIIHCTNPPGIISSDLIKACRKSVNADGTVLVVVDGEEDLVPIPIHMMLPLDSHLIYGQPNKGVVVRISDETVKQRCREMFAAFEVIS